MMSSMVRGEVGCWCMCARGVGWGVALVDGGLSNGGALAAVVGVFGLLKTGCERCGEMQLLRNRTVSM